MTGRVVRLHRARTCVVLPESQNNAKCTDNNAIFTRRSECKIRIYFSVV